MANFVYPVESLRDPEFVKKMGHSVLGRTQRCASFRTSTVRAVGRAWQVPPCRDVLRK
jgi:hypothetical protein